MALLEIKNLKKVYTSRMGGMKVCALNDVSFFLWKKVSMWRLWVNLAQERQHC